MTLVTFSNFLLMLLCVAVIVQSIRLTKSFQAIRSSALNDSVVQLDRATGQAKAVLAELKFLLSTHGVAQTKAVKAGEELRDELSVMVGIGNAVAERIMDAVAAQNAARTDNAAAGAEASAGAAVAKAPRRAPPRKPRSRGGTRPKGEASSAGKRPATVNA